MINPQSRRYLRHQQRQPRVSSGALEHRSTHRSPLMTAPYPVPRPPYKPGYVTIQTPARRCHRYCTIQAQTRRFNHRHLCLLGSRSVSAAGYRDRRTYLHCVRRASMRLLSYILPSKCGILYESASLGEPAPLATGSNAAFNARSQSAQNLRREVQPSLRHPSIVSRAEK